METIVSILNRRSIRSYEDRPISDEALHTILEAAMFAPSAVNFQPWYFVVIRSSEQRRRIKSIMSQISEQIEPSLRERFANHPAVVQETTKFVRQMGGAPVCVLAFQGKQDYKKTESTIVQSVAAAIENMLLAAWDIGIGSCWLTAPIEAEKQEELRQMFAPSCGPLVAMITLGYAKQIPPVPKRKEGRFVII